MIAFLKHHLSEVNHASSWAISYLARISRRIWSGEIMVLEYADLSIGPCPESPSL